MASDSVGPGQSPEFGDPAYWENLYAASCSAEGDATDEWLAGWEQLSWLLEALLAHDHSRTVLHLGCGNSCLAEDMYDAGYKRQTSVDISPTVITHMLARNSSLRPDMQWIAADATELPMLQDDLYDLVIDKSTIDALVCHDEHALVLAKFVKEAFRVTAPNGVYVCVSMHRPNVVMPWLRRRAFKWKIRSVTVQDDGSVQHNGCRARAGSSHVYICSKQGPAADSLPVNWPSLLARVTARPDSDLSCCEDDEEEMDVEEESANEQ